MRNLLNHTALVEKIATDQTEQGTFNPTYSTRIASLSCLVQMKRLQEPIEFGKKTIRVIYRIYCMASDGSAIIKSDRITWNSRTLEVISHPKDGGGQDHHLEIDCIEVK